MPGPDIRAGVRRLFRLAIHRPETAAADADAELEALVAEEVRYLVGLGVAPEEARAQAFRRITGGRENLAAAAGRVRRSAEQRERRMKFRDWLDDLAHDIRTSLRTLRRAPALVVAAVLTLSLAIGANTAIFSAVNAVILRPLPFAEPDRLVMLWESNPDFQWERAEAAPANLLDWKEQTDVFTDIAGYPSFASTATLTGYGEPRLLRAQSVTGNFFSVLGVGVQQGRTFRDAETWSTGGPPVAILSYAAWRDVFGSDRTLVGRTIELEGDAVEVVGVLPADFAFPGIEAEVWRPVRWDPADRSQTWFRRAHWVRPVARLNPGVDRDRADAALQTVVARLQREYPQTNTNMGAGMTPLHEFLVGNTRLPLLIMLGGVGALLLIACANVANLLLVRAAGREREAAVRMALGAGRGRLFRQALLDNGLLAIAGGGLGLALGAWGTRALSALQPRGMLPIQEIGLNWGAVGYAAGVTLLSALVFGVAPTLWTVRRVPADVLRDEGRSSSGGLRGRRWGEILLVGQVTMALVLTLGAGLLARSYVGLIRVEPGFDPSNVLAVSVNLPGTRYDSAAKIAGFFRELEDQARGLPGVEYAAVTSRLSLGPPGWTSQFAVEGKPPLAQTAQILHREISGDYHRVMRVPLLRGRLIEPTDRQDTPFAVLINETMARRFFPDQDPIGQRIAFDRIPDSTSVWRTIVGVVGDERQEVLGREPEPEVYAPYPQEVRMGMVLIVRTGGNPVALAPAIRGIVARLDPQLAIGWIRTAEEIRSESLARDRFLTVLMLSLSGVGLVLGLIGVYGVMAQVARRRIREMGIRIALGARVAQVQWLVVRRGLLLAAAGIGAGVAVALLASRIIQALLYRVGPADPVTFTLVPVLVLGAAALASWFPAARSGREDPSRILRAE